MDLAALVVDSRVVDQGVDATPYIADLLGQTPDGFFVGDVDDEGLDVCARVPRGLGRGLQILLVDVHQPQNRSFGGKALGRGTADAGRRPRDDDSTVLETFHGVLSSVTPGRSRDECLPVRQR